MIKVIIADDQTLFRKMLEEILAKDTEIRIVATAADGKEAVALAKHYRPDIILLDIKMPEKSGIEALKELKIVLPEVKIMMLTTFEDVESITESCSLGADGYLVKDMKPEVLKMAIKCVYHDIVLFHRTVYHVIAPALSVNSLNTKEKFEFGNLSFDAVDIQIIKLIAEGRTNKEIAQILNYSEGTIKNKVSRILGMTGFSDRTQISVFAIKNNII